MWCDVYDCVVMCACDMKGVVYVWGGGIYPGVPHLLTQVPGTAGAGVGGLGVGHVPHTHFGVGAKRKRREGGEGE